MGLKHSTASLFVIVPKEDYDNESITVMPLDVYFSREDAEKTIVGKDKEFYIAVSIYQVSEAISHYWYS